VRDDVNLQPGGSPLRFRLTLTSLVILLVAAPIAAISFFDLDARTPFTIAQDSLYDQYGLVFVDEHGNPLPEGSGDATVSQFSLESGATTEGVAFGLHGEIVSCSVHAPNDDPQDVTAICE
jgi:hypothetical protein